MKKSCYGIDIGGTTVKIGCFSPEGTLERKWEIVTRTENGGAHILSDIAEALKADMAANGLTPEDVMGAGMGIPGPVDDEGVVNRCVNLGWGVFNVSQTFSQLFYGLPLKAGNDANVAAMGEAHYGGGRGYDSIVMVTLGTGIGGGIVLDGRILNGSNGAAGEIGHMPIWSGARRDCGCGNRGCMEQIGSATGIIRRAQDLLADTDIPSPLRKVEKIMAKDVLDLHGQDVIADRVIDEAAETLGRGLACIAAVVNPEAFVIGGGVSKAGQWFMDKIEASFREHAFHACRNGKIVLAELGNDGGMYGAAAMIRQFCENRGN